MVVSKVIRVSKSNIYQYTLTLYFTKCRFLVNGKNVSIFIEQDMQNIHDVMNTVILNGKAVDLKTINSLLQQQLLKVQEHLRTTNIHRQVTTVPSINDKSIKSSDPKCIKCKRNVISRGVLCNIGQHWVHYICDRLTKQEIEKLEQRSHNENYSCKTCDNKGDTYSSKPCLQITEAIHEQTIEKTTITTNVDIHHKTCSDKLQQLLDEELTLTCLVCSEEIIENTLRCTSCLQPCHQKCSAFDNYEHTCIHCIALNEPEKAGTPVEQHSGFQNMHDNQTTEPKTYYTSDNTHDGSNSEAVDSIVMNEHSASYVTNIPVTKNKTEKDIKQSELRQREQKLRKREEELNIREKILEETQNEKIWLQTYVTKLETKINELEHSNSILKKKCELLQTNHTDNHFITNSEINNSQSHCNNKSSSGTETLLNKLQDKVSNFILQQMDEQIDKMIGSTNKTTNNVEIVQPEQSNVHRNNTTQPIIQRDQATHRVNPVPPKTNDTPKAKQRVFLPNDINKSAPQNTSYEQRFMGHPVQYMNTQNGNNHRTKSQPPIYDNNMYKQNHISKPGVLQPNGNQQPGIGSTGARSTQCAWELQANCSYRPSIQRDTVTSINQNPFLWTTPAAHNWR